MNMLELKNNIPLTNTKIIEKYTGVKHQNILQLFRRHKKSIEKFGVIMFETWKPKKGSKGGRPENFYYLNEQQLTFFIMLMANSERVVKFKEDIAKEFFRMKKILLNLSTQKANQEYLEARGKGKVSRLKETDTIKQFIQYATKQGSKNANKYYITLTNIENKALFLIEQKFKNIREILNINQLDEIKQADEIVLKALNDGMIDNMKYKDIYQLAKKRVELFASLKGKSIVPSIEFKMIGD